MANKIEQKYFSVYFNSGIEPIECTLNSRTCVSIIWQHMRYLVSFPILFLQDVSHSITTNFMQLKLEWVRAL